MALIAAQYNNVYIHVPKFEMGVENKSEEFLKMNPNGKVPVLKTPEGAIFESTAIARYVARMRNDTGLLGRTFFEEGKVDQWIDWATCELVPHISSWFGVIMGFAPPNPKIVEQAKEALKRPLAALNTYLASHLFLERVDRSVEITVKLAFLSTCNAVINNAITINKKESRIINSIYQ